MNLLLSCGFVETASFPFTDSLAGYFELISFNLFLTLIIEVPVAFLLGVRKRKDVETVMFTNAVSNPVLITIVFLLLHFQNTSDPYLYALLSYQRVHLLDIPPLPNKNYCLIDKLHII